MATHLRFAALDELGRAARAAFKRFPAVMAMALLCGALSLCIDLEGPERRSQARLFALLGTSTPGIAAMFIAHVLAELRPRLPRAVLFGVPLLALGLFYASYAVSPQPLFAQRFILYFASLHLLVALLGQLLSHHGFWQWNGLLFFRLL